MVHLFLCVFLCSPSNKTANCEHSFATAWNIQSICLQNAAAKLKALDRIGVHNVEPLIVPFRA
jgi:hypothetical protein